MITAYVARQVDCTWTVAFGRLSSAKDSLVAAAHTAVLDDYPEDTDVFHVLVRTPRVAEYIITEAFVFTIAPTGSIKYAGRREDILGKSN